MVRKDGITPPIHVFEKKFEKQSKKKESENETVYII